MERTIGVHASFKREYTNLRCRSSITSLRKDVSTGLTVTSHLIAPFPQTRAIRFCELLSLKKA